MYIGMLILSMANERRADGREPGQLPGLYSASRDLGGHAARDAPFAGKAPRYAALPELSSKFRTAWYNGRHGSRSAARPRGRSQAQFQHVPELPRERDDRPPRFHPLLM